MRKFSVLLGVGILVLGPWAPQAQAFPDPIGGCLGSGCPSEPYDPPSSGEFVGTDEAINVFVGGSMRVIEQAAESEGKLVTLGDLDVERSSTGSYNIGIVGAGSRITPPSGADHAIIGGSLEANALSTIHLGGSDLNETRWGNLVHGGATTISPGDRLDLTPDGELINRDDTAEYAALRGTITELSTCAATYEATGTVDVEFGTATFTGDGTSALQVFTLPDDLGSSGSTVALAFEGIPTGATTVVNMLGANPDIFVNSVLGTLASPLHTRLVWNFPVASAAGIRGSGQIPGSILVGPAASTTTITVPGTNGRVLLAGDLVHGGGGGGEELHSYPFNGTLPPCDDPGGGVDVDAAGTDAGVDADAGADADAAGVDGADADGTDADAGADGVDSADGAADADGDGSASDGAAADTDAEALPDTGGAPWSLLLLGVVCLAGGVAVSARARRP